MSPCKCLLIEAWGLSIIHSWRYYCCPCRRNGQGAIQGNFLRCPLTEYILYKKSVQNLNFRLDMENFQSVETFRRPLRRNLLIQLTGSKTSKEIKLLKTDSKEAFYSRVRNKCTHTSINFWNLFQELQSYYGLQKLKFYYISLYILRGYVYSV